MPGITIPSNATSVTINTDRRGAGDAQRPDRAEHGGAPSSSPPSPTRPGWTRRATTCCCRAPPAAAPATGNPASPGFGTVMQGFIETSNVNVVTEITNLISAQRAYEMNSRVITTSDQMLSTLTNMH